MTATDTKPVADIPDDKLHEEHERLVNMLFRQGRWCGTPIGVLWQRYKDVEARLWKLEGWDPE